MKGLYAIVDAQTCRARGVELLAHAEALLRASPAVLQLRAKDSSDEDVVTWLRALRPMARPRGVLLFANDRPDLAMDAGADGVHGGQTDMPVAQVRSRFPSLRVGVSTHSLAQLKEALSQRPDYVALGPIYGTRSKANPEPVVGPEVLPEAHRLCLAASIPLVAIGGITLSNVGEVAPHVESVAMIGALCTEAGAPLEGVTQRALSVHRWVRGEGVEGEARSWA